MFWAGRNHRAGISTAAWTTFCRVSHRLPVGGRHGDERLVRTGGGRGLSAGLRSCRQVRELSLGMCPQCSGLSWERGEKGEGSTQNTPSHAPRARAGGGGAEQAPARQGSQPIPAESLRNRLCRDSSTAWCCYTLHKPQRKLSGKISLRDIFLKVRQTER